MLDTSPFKDFTSASQAVLRHLHDRMKFNLWMVTRTDGEHWIVLQANDHGYGIKDGQVFQWADSFCSRMVDGKGPRVAPDSNSVAAYAEAPIGGAVKIGAYIGVPISKPDGTLFGTLCAIHPEAHPQEIKEEQGMMELLAKLLSTVLATDLEAQSAQRQAERATADATRDELTGLRNRRAWIELLAAEEQRCHRYGHNATVVMLDVNGLKVVNDRQGHAAGDELLRKVARAITSATRNSDVVARLGGDEFAILAVECDAAGGEALMGHLNDALDAEGVHVAIGVCQRTGAADLNEACMLADASMYLRKRSSRLSRPA